ncbi:MAG TPA: hypothetical protein VHB54_12590 [Mucilaginibacter sp.]|nr:hypothetical protein [Mucilaginibacter sp.]
MDLNNDGNPDTIKLISSLEGRNDFNRISITLTGIRTAIFKAKDFWTEVDPEFLVKNQNAIRTKLLFLKRTPLHTVILLFGEDGEADYRGELSIINIENKKIVMAFDQVNGDNLITAIALPITLTDLNYDGRLDFVSKDWGELERPVPGGNIGSYDPYYVCPINNILKIDTPLTKAYNEKHYVYAGLDFGKEITIFYPKNGSTPRVWKKKSP